MLIPPPQTFAEGQRAIALWLMAAAGMFAGVMIVAILSVLIWGGWPDTLYRLILYIVAGAMAGFVVSMIAVILALAVGGPVGRFRVSADRHGASFDVDDKGDAAATVVNTRTTVTPPQQGPST